MEMVCIATRLLCHRGGSHRNQVSVTWRWLAYKPGHCVKEVVHAEPSWCVLGGQPRNQLNVMWKLFILKLGQIVKDLVLY